MKRTLAILLPLLFAAPALAQTDVIEWRDGTKTTRIKVTAFDGREVTYKQKGRQEKAPAHRVKNLKVEAWNDVYARDVAAEDFYGTAEDQLKKGNKFAAQYGYWRAGMLFLDSNKIGSAISALEQLDKSIPESGFAPALYTTKIRHYLSDPTKTNIANAVKVSEAYEAEVTKRGWSTGFELEASFYLTLSNGMGGKYDKSALSTRLKDLAAKADGRADFVAAKALIQLADMARHEKRNDEAKKSYESIMERKGVDADIQARALLGLGHLDWEKGVLNNDKEAYHQAYLNFLRVYILAKDAHPDHVAEALYHAARAVVKWSGLPTANAEAARLRSRLKLREPYKSTKWASK